MSAIRQRNAKCNGGFRSRDPRNAPQETADFSGSGTGLGLDAGFSFTKLLGLEDEGQPAGTPIPPPLLSGTAGAPDHLAPAWRRLVAPPGVFTSPLPPGQVRRSPHGMRNEVFPSRAAGDRASRLPPCVCFGAVLGSAS